MNDQVIQTLERIGDSLKRLGEVVEKGGSGSGDKPGHPFRGNQWEGGSGGDRGRESVKPERNPKLQGGGREGKGSDVEERDLAWKRSDDDIERIEKELIESRTSSGTTEKRMKSAIKMYTSGGDTFFDVNSSLRNGKTIDEIKPKPGVQDLQKLASGSLEKPTIVYRGMRSDVAADVLGIRRPFFGGDPIKLDTVQLGAEVEAKGFVSTTLKPETASHFGQVVLEIKARTGLYVNDHSMWGTEYELIQRHGAKYKIVGTREGRPQVVMLEEI